MSDLHVVTILRPGEGCAFSHYVDSLKEAVDMIEAEADRWLDTIPEGAYTSLLHRQYRGVIEAHHAWPDEGGETSVPDGTQITVRRCGS